MNTRTSIFARVGQAVRRFLGYAWRAINPGEDALRGAAAAVLAVSALVYLVFAVKASQGPLLFFLPALLVLLLMGGLLLWAGQGIAWLIGLLARIPWGYRWVLAGGLLLLSLSFMFRTVERYVVVVLILLLPATLLGTGLWLLTHRRSASRSQFSAAVVAVVFSALVLLSGLGWYALWRGANPEPEVNAAALAGAPRERLSLPDPSQPGPFAVKTLTYGSGTDRFRPEYGKAADLITTSVDGSNLLYGSWKGLYGDLRELVWGFDPNQLPLNGRVWYPDGSGPFPLVLMVHGNHNMMDFSDPGYAYLGELLASRGYIFVSVDENFINGGLVDFLDSFSGENDARGWLLLEHLRVWHRWNADPANLFYQLVDTENIAVAGHSRGGEAAAIAAAFNRLPAYPDYFAKEFHYNYNIRAVIAIAPIDGQYLPAKQPTPLSNVNYFVLQGSHDSDLTSFDGVNQYARVAFDPGTDWFKASLYIYRANHGQFNTTWGDADVPLLTTGFLNRTALLSGEEQRQVAKVYISAFLDAALRGERGYLPLFQDARAAGEGWLPDTIYINRLDLAGDRVVASFTEDINLKTTTLPGGHISAQNVNGWREQRMDSKWSETEFSAVYLNWKEGQKASYTLTLPGETAVALDGSESLIFTLADADDAPPAENPPEGGSESAARQPLDLTILLEDSSGETARLPLSDYGLVQPQLPVYLYKARLFEEKDIAEPVLQSYAIPLVDFTSANPAFDPARVRRISFVFDRTQPGSLIIESVGFRP